MNSTFACTALLLICLSGPALAETAKPSAASCNLTGQPTLGDDACTAMRTAFRKDVTDCMARLETEAAARATTTVSMNSHTYRARYHLCFDEVTLSLAE